MDSKGVNLRLLQSILLPEWQEMARRGEPLSQLIDYSALLAINGSIVNRLFREANVPQSDSGPILSLRHSKKKAVDKRNQRTRDRTDLSGLDEELSALVETKIKLEAEKDELTNEISFYKNSWVSAIIIYVSDLIGCCCAVFSNARARLVWLFNF